MENKIRLLIFYTLILGLFTIVLCTESSVWLSGSIALIFTLTGAFIGQLIKNKKKLFVDYKVRVLSGLFLLAIVASLSFYFFLDNSQNKVIYISLTNLILASGSLLYLLVTGRKA